LLIIATLAVCYFSRRYAVPEEVHCAIAELIFNKGHFNSLEVVGSGTVL